MYECAHVTPRTAAQCIHKLTVCGQATSVTPPCRALPDAEMRRVQVGAGGGERGKGGGGLLGVGVASGCGPKRALTILTSSMHAFRLVKCISHRWVAEGRNTSSPSIAYWGGRGNLTKTTHADPETPWREGEGGGTCKSARGNFTKVSSCWRVTPAVPGTDVGVCHQETQHVSGHAGMTMRALRPTW